MAQNNNNLYMKRYRIFSAFLLSFLLFSGCYSFQGITIDCGKMKTFSVADIKNNAQTIVPGLSQTFAEALRQKIRTNTCLENASVNADAMLSGVIREYSITALAQQAGATTAFNRLTIRASIEYKNMTNSKESWTKTFTRFADFDSSQNLLSVQDDLINEINEQLVEDIFDAAFVNW